ncbi:MAG: tetratricopeptide repeat protein [Candidatus Sumerlaeota bacterium]|nr:tetratricopeptide repeat protein [Candidatus Sumerlaeota bacterium]
MRKGIFISLCLSLVVLLLTGAAGNQQERLRVTAGLNKTTFIIGEPIYLTFNLKNMTDDALEFRTRLSLYSDVRIIVSIPEKMPEDYTGIYEQSLTPNYVFKIPPRETDHITFTILYKQDSGDGIYFKTPLEATLSISLEGIVASTPEKFQMPQVVVEIKAPDEKDKHALAFLTAKRLIRDIHTGRASRNDMGAFETFLKDFPDATYTPYALYCLASGLMIGGKDEKGDIKQAIARFQDFIARYPQHPLVDGAVYRIGDCYDRLGDTVQAKKWFVKLYNQYPNSSRVTYSDPLLAKYLFGTESENISPGNWVLY